MKTNRLCIDGKDSACRNNDIIQFDRYFLSVMTGKGSSSSSSLFALEVYMHTFQVYPSPSRCDPLPFDKCHVAFQLAQFEPLVFDESLRRIDAEGIYVYRTGKSCLFEIDADAFHENVLRTPLCIALMMESNPSPSPRHQPSKLLAFTCIDMESFGSVRTTHDRQVVICNTHTHG